MTTLKNIFTPRVSIFILCCFSVLLLTACKEEQQPIVIRISKPALTNQTAVQTGPSESSSQRIVSQPAIVPKQSSSKTAAPTTPAANVGLDKFHTATNIPTQIIVTGHRVLGVSSSTHYSNFIIGGVRIEEALNDTGTEVTTNPVESIPLWGLSQPISYPGFALYNCGYTQVMWNSETQPTGGSLRIYKAVFNSSTNEWQPTGPPVIILKSPHPLSFSWPSCSGDYVIIPVDANGGPMTEVVGYPTRLASGGTQDAYQSNTSSETITFTVQ